MLVLAMTVTSLGVPGAQAATKSKNYVSPYVGKKYVFATNYNNGIYAYNKKGKLVKKYTVVKGIDKEYSMGAVYKTKIDQPFVQLFHHIGGVSAGNMVVDVRVGFT